MKNVRYLAIATAAAGLVTCALIATPVDASGRIAKKRAPRSSHTKASTHAHASTHAAPVHFAKPAMSAEEALTVLRVGNERFAKDSPSHPHADGVRRAELAKGQKPPTVVLTCSDSRVPPELIFDQGLGDLFVVRVAGNSVDPMVFGSVEYAVEHLGSRLIVVLGHEKCGAVAAAIKGGAAHHHLPAVLDPIKPAVRSTVKMTGDRLAGTVHENVRNNVRRLKRDSRVVAEGILRHDVRVQGAVYDLDHGRVSWIY